METKRKRQEQKLSERMKREAVKLGLCAQWTEEWEKNTTKDDMVDKFVRGLDFCIEHDWPSTEVMKKDFGDVIHKHGVYVDERVTKQNPSVMILNGHSDASVTCDGYAASDIHVRHTSRLRLSVTGMAVVYVRVYDKAEVDVECTDSAKCFVYRYSGTVVAKGSTIVRERKKDNL